MEAMNATIKAAKAAGHWAFLWISLEFRVLGGSKGLQGLGVQGLRELCSVFRVYKASVLLYPKPYTLKNLSPKP